ncbi:hypothetical protein M407DRAFT_24728 [Tulasnella calospora MUT 4182]|uniref:F-box domain-containing protein n=1 Tax=Tulasnella calospora MUT 4182 TaxID=1051891 RepID=A0A0C3QIW1_9AGAM|nr:hypothetical protein M407DRAFT_24728 [Tulasnella calospora MUT 4182]
MADRIRLSLRAFEDRAHTVLSGLIQTRNALTPINNLPTEIIVRIWALAARDSAESGHDMLRSLAGVCKWWRDKVLAHSELWGEGVSTHFSEQRVAWAIQKSGIRDLYVCVDNGALNQHQDRFDQVLPHAHRWASLTLSLDRYSDSVFTLRILHLPKLQRLEIRRWGNRFFHTRVEPPGAPNLRALHLTAVPLNWDAMGFPRLRVIKLERVTRMGPSLDQLFHLISSAPELEELVLQKVAIQPSEDAMYDTEPETSSHPYISAPNLQTLRLNEMETEVAAWILCSLCPTGYRLVVVDFLPTSVLQTHLSHLHSCLVDTFSYGMGLTIEVSYQVISIHTAGMPDQSEDSLVDARGLELQFGCMNPAEDLEHVSSFFAERHIPLTIDITFAATQFQDHLSSLQLHKLSSLRTLRIAYPINPNTLLHVLEQPLGPRQNLWWPCPLLSTLEIGSHDYIPEPDRVDLDTREVVEFLRRRWGDPPQEDFTLGQSRPTQLSVLVHKSDIIDRLTRREDGLLQHVTVSYRRFRPVKPVERREDKAPSD